MKYEITEEQLKELGSIYEQLEWLDAGWRLRALIETIEMQDVEDKANV